MVQRVGFIGNGNMGGAILSGALSAGVLDKEHTYVYDILPKARQRATDLGVHVTSDNGELTRASEVVILAVKPRDTPTALSQCGDALEGKALFSIVAGASVKYLRTLISGRPRILRLLPNTPALVHAGAFALSSDNDLLEPERQLADSLFSSLGIVEYVPERLIDAVCGLSGGAPAYVAMFIEAMADGGVLEGLPRPVAYRLAAQTCLGAAQLILQKGLLPAEVKDAVTSPAGTTIEGCQVLERGGFRGAVIDAIRAGAEKSRHLA